MANEQNRATLLAWLQTAIELELSTIPPYMVALLSIEQRSNREAADLIRGVMIEEMLHLALVANVLNAVGGEPKLGPKNIPSYPLRLNFQGRQFKDREFPVSLARFSKENIATFMKIEEPEALAAPRAAMVKEIDVPGLTIGEFYNNIIALLEQVNSFPGDPARQLHDDYYWGGGNKIIPVSDLDSAKAALEIVITQGEGAWRRPGAATAFTPGQPLRMGHYYRFAEIFYGRHYTDKDDPAKPPTGAPLPVDYEKVFPIKTNPKSTDYRRDSDLARLNHSFNAQYSEMLRQVGQAISGAPKTLYTAIMNGMHGMPPIALRMMTAKIEDSTTTGCPTFEWV